jgi:glucose-6-phosphate-specific signal transduction histidine kinase
MVGQRMPVLDAAGLMTRPWFNLFSVLQQLTQNGRAAVTTTPFTMKLGVTYAFVNVAGAASVTLPNVTGVPITVKDASGAAAANNITIHPSYGLVDGAATAALVANHQSQTYIGDGTNWWII